MVWVKPWAVLCIVLVPSMLILTLLPFLLTTNNNVLEDTEKKWQTRRTECITSASKSDKNLTEIQHRLYYFSDKNMTWVEAEQACKKIGLDLISTEDWAEQDTFNLRLNETTKSAWSSGTNTSDGHWQWSTKQRISKYLIRHNNVSTGQCLVLKYNNVKLLMEANNCNTRYHYICECNLI